MDNQLPSTDFSKAPLCKCKDETGVPCFTVHRISKTDKNKDREFYACSLSKDKGGCGFFSWLEDLYTDEKTGLVRKKYIPLPDGYVKKPTAAETLTALELRVVALEDYYSTLKNRIQIAEESLKHLEEHGQQSRKVQKTESGRTVQQRKQ